MADRFLYLSALGEGRCIRSASRSRTHNVIAFFSSSSLLEDLDFEEPRRDLVLKTLAVRIDGVVISSSKGLCSLSVVGFPLISAHGFLSYSLFFSLSPSFSFQENTTELRARLRR